MAVRRPLPPPPGWLFGLIGLAAFGFLLSVYVRAWTPEFGITRFLVAGQKFDERGIAAYRATPKYLDPYPAHAWGFDGQFYAEIALDPLLRDPQLGTALDDPTYRPRRILLSWLAALGGLGRPFWVLNVYAALNLIFWIGYAFLAARLFRPYRWAGLCGFAAVLLTCGIIECMHGSLTDFPSFVLMTAAAVLGGTGGAAVLALSALARESSLLGFVGLVETGPSLAASLKKNLPRFVLAALPVVLWSAYVLWRFRDRSFGGAGGNLGMPLHGMMEKAGELSVDLLHGPIRWHRLRTEFYRSYELHALLTMVSVLTQCIFLALHREWRHPLWRIGAAFAVYFLCITYLSWESHFTITRHALPVTLAFNLFLAARAVRGRVAWFLLGNCFVPFGLFYFSSSVQRPPSPAEFAIVAPAVPGALQATYAAGWTGQLWAPKATWRWAQQARATITVQNNSGRNLRAEMKLIVRTHVPRQLTIELNGRRVAALALEAGTRGLVLPALDLSPGENRLEFQASGDPVRTDDGTAEDVYFSVENPALTAAAGPGGG